MRKVTDAVRDIILTSDTPLEALRLGILNLSAYSQQIQKQVEKATWKPVQTGTITVALSRMSTELRSVSPLRPKVMAQDVSIQANVCDMSFEKTEDALAMLPQLQSHISHTRRTVFVQTVGMSEITFIVSSDLKDVIVQHMPQKPLALYENLVGITLGFPKEYIDVPNAIYSIISSVAAKRINIIEIVSTYTELMFVVEKKDQEACVHALETHL